MPNFMNNNLPGMGGMNNMNGMRINGMNMGIGLPQNFAAGPHPNVLPNINGFNPNFNLMGQMKNNFIPAQPHSGPASPGPVAPANGYNFKQKETVSPSAGPSSAPASSSVI